MADGGTDQLHFNQSYEWSTYQQRLTPQGAIQTLLRFNCETPSLVDLEAEELRLSVSRVSRAEKTSKLKIFAQF